MYSASVQMDFMCMMNFYTDSNGITGLPKEKKKKKLHHLLVCKLIWITQFRLLNGSLSQRSKT